MCQMVNIPMAQWGKRRRESILLSQAEKAVIRWEEEGCQLTYLQDNKIVSHVSGIETVGWEKWPPVEEQATDEEGDRERELSSTV